MKLYLANCQRNEKNTQYPRATDIISLDALTAATKYDHVAPKMMDAHRSDDNFVEADCIMMDLDNTHSSISWDWKTVDDISDTFPDVKFYCISSRSHMKEKVYRDPKTREIKARYEPRTRLHVYFPLSRTYTDREEYRSLMVKAAALFPYFDIAAAKPAQFFYGNNEPTVSEDSRGETCLDTYLKTVSEDGVRASIVDFATKIYDHVYEPENGETPKAVKVLCDRFHVILPWDSRSDESSYTSNQSVVEGDDEGLSISRIEQQRRVVWLKDWSSQYRAYLGEPYNINTNDHPEGIVFPTKCPWGENHTESTGDRESVIIVDLGGKLNFLCRHEHCADKGWKAFRRYHEGKVGEGENDTAKYDAAAADGFFTYDGEPDVPFVDSGQARSKTTEDKKPGLPLLVNFAEAFKQGLPELEEPVIEGVVRQGGKLLVTASSKAGKTQLCVLLTVALSEGGLWLAGIKCRKSKVLYVNFELSNPQILNRFKTVYWELQKDPRGADFDILTLKGRYDKIFPVAENFAPRLIEVIKQHDYDAVVLDPIYKLFQADENSAETISEFGRYTDRIIQETGCTLIYTHHHSKGAQGGKNAMDRGSGSGVFSRDADAIVDFLEIEPKDCGVTLEEGEAAFRVEFGGLRSFPRRPPIEVVSHYPLFVQRDDLGGAKAKYGCGDASTNARRGNLKKQEQRDANISVLRNFVRFAIENGNTYSIDDAAEAMDKSRSTIRNYISSEGSGMKISNNNIYITEDGGKT